MKRRPSREEVRREFARELLAAKEEGKTAGRSRSLITSASSASPYILRLDPTQYVLHEMFCLGFESGQKIRRHELHMVAAEELANEAAS